MTGIGNYVVLAGVLFTIGGVGFLVRRNVLVALMSIAAEAADVAVCLAIVLSLFRIKRTVRSDEADLLKN